MDGTKIAWTDETLNVTRGCTAVSAGCTHCYAQRMAHRFSGPGKPYEGLTRMTSHGPKWTDRLRLVPEALTAPLRWRKPRRVFVNSMSDLFHERVPDGYIDKVFAVMALAPQHTFQVLTKRPERMRRYFERVSGGRHIWTAGQLIAMPKGQHKSDPCWPLPNVWLGVSAENQETLDERVPLLLDTPAAVRFVSAEPLLSSLDCSFYLPQTGCPGHRNASLDWVIVGGESGPGARPCDVEWIQAIVEQCAEANVACFVKQLGAFAASHRWICCSPQTQPGTDRRLGLDRRRG